MFTVDYDNGSILLDGVPLFYYIGIDAANKLEIGSWEGGDLRANHPVFEDMRVLIISGTAFDEFHENPTPFKVTVTAEQLDLVLDTSMELDFDTGFVLGPFNTLEDISVVVEYATATLFYFNENYKLVTKEFSGISVEIQEALPLIYSLC